MKRFIKFIVKCVLLFFLCAGAFFGYSGYKQYKDLTSNKNVAQIVETIEASPDFIPYEQLPKTLVDATVAIEDRRFFYHHGVDYIGIVRAVASQFVPGMLESGGSTISQQTVKKHVWIIRFFSSKKGRGNLSSQRSRKHLQQRRDLCPLCQYYQLRKWVHWDL